jgi:S1-C subfamily serine protease
MTGRPSARLLRAALRRPGAGAQRVAWSLRVRLNRPLAAAMACCAGALAVGCGAEDPQPQVVRVTVAQDGLLPEIATGVATGDERVLTVAHVLDARHAVTVAGRRARVLRIDRGLDLALLSVPGLRAPALRLGGDGKRTGLVVLRDGRPRSLAGAVRRHVLVRWSEQPGDPPSDRPGLELAATVDPGDSGAPVLDPDGRLIGVLYARADADDGTAWAVDASAVRRLLAR